MGVGADCWGESCKCGSLLPDGALSKLLTSTDD